MAIEAMKLALEALDAYSWEQVDAARAALRTAIAEAEKHMTDDELHLAAAAYAGNRKNAYVAAMHRGDVDQMSEELLNGKWLAHYEGYREGYWVATGDTKFSTDPVKLKEKNT